jgi:tetratricopeptide (TPR) repeat protein
MNLLLLGSNYFQNALRSLGHRVTWAGADPGCDMTTGSGDVYVPDLLRLMPDPPDAIILTDDLGRRAFPSGLERVAALKVWYAVDSPINYFWQKHWAPLFDLVLVDQKTCAKELARFAPGRVHWLPVAVPTGQYLGQPEPKTNDIAFVGVINDTVRPKRSNIIHLLKKRYRLRLAGGRKGEWVKPRDAARLYRQARIVLNENLFNGITTRMFEAMASGTMLLTEAGQDGIEDLFTPGEDLALYGPETLVEQVDYYLSHPGERESLARRGRERVLAAHDIKHRAQILLDFIGLARPSDGQPGQAAGCREQGKALFLAGLRWPGHDGPFRLARAEKHLIEAESLGGADPETEFYLGLIDKTRGDYAVARTRWAAAAEAGSLRARLALGLLDLEFQRPAAVDHFRAAAEVTGLEFPIEDPSARISPDQHHALGRMLEAHGHDLTLGFSRFGLDMSMWTAFEHYRAAVDENPDHLPALIDLGRLLTGNGANAQAYSFLSRAAELAPGRTDLADMIRTAGRLGYVTQKSSKEAA